MRDWRGVPIEVGSQILYPIRKGSSLRVNVGTVKEITETRMYGELVPCLVIRFTSSSSRWYNVTDRYVRKLTSLRDVTVLR